MSEDDYLGLATDIRKPPGIIRQAPQRLSLGPVLPLSCATATSHGRRLQDTHPLPDSSRHNPALLSVPLHDNVCSERS